MRFPPFHLSMVFKTPRSVAARYGAAVLAVAAATFLRAFLTPVLASAFPFVTYLAAITLVGWIGGGGPAAVAVVLSALAASHWFLPPAFSLLPHDAETLLGVGVFLVMGGMIAVTCGSMKRAQDRAEEQARLLEEKGTVLQRHMTELVRSQIEADERMRRVSEVLASMTECYASFDREFRFAEVNPHAAAYLRSPADALLGRTVWEVFPGIDHSRIGELLREGQRRQVMLAEEVPSVRQPGHFIDFHLYPRAGGVDAYWRDITDRKLAERALRESEERLSLALDVARMGTCEWNVSTGDCVWSEHHFTLFGYTHEPGSHQATYAMWESCLHPDDAPRVMIELSRASEEVRVYQAEFRIRRADDGAVRWIQARGQFFPEEAGKGRRLIGVVFDITERRRAQEDLRQAMHDLERSKRELEERVSELEAFHDIVVGRELKMMTLERELAEIKRQR